MKRTLLPLLAIVSATVLVAGYLEHALIPAGKYATLPTVRIPVAIALALTYSSVIGVALLLHGKVSGRSDRLFALPLLILLASLVGALIWLAPLAPYLGVALLCQFQVTCPDAANPISWAFLGLIGPRELPFSPVWVVVATLLVSLLAKTISGRWQRAS